MKNRLFMLCAAALLLCADASAQKNDLSRVPAKTATLVSHVRHKDYDKSVFNFQHGVRGDKRFPGRRGVVGFKNLPDNRGLHTGQVGDSQEARDPKEMFRLADDTSPNGRRDAAEPTAARVRYDIRYGGLTLNGSNDWLEIVNLRGQQSVIKDLGAMTWDEVTRVPHVPASPEPYTGVVRYARGGIAAPENVVVRAVAGHMYVLHVKDRGTDYYVMFRVEALDPAGECRLSWKRVPSPKS